MGSLKFVWNPSGYAEVKNSSAVQDIVREKAQKVKDRANASLSVGGYTAIDDFEMHEKTNSKDGTRLQVVVTHSEHAKRAQNQRKALANSLGAANGGN